VNLMRAHHTLSSEIAPLSTPWPANFLDSLCKVVCAQDLLSKGQQMRSNRSISRSHSHQTHHCFLFCP
jgi:hypothetical protein